MSYLSTKEEIREMRGVTLRVDGVVKSGEWCGVGGSRLNHDTRSFAVCAGRIVQHALVRFATGRQRESGVGCVKEW